MLTKINNQLQQQKNEAALLAAVKFVPNATNVIGVRMPVLNDLAKEYKNGGFDLVQQLWQQNTYEHKILAAKILGKISKQNPLLAIQLLKKFSVQIDNWALCDTIGMQSLKAIVGTHQKETFALANTLIGSNLMWQRRLALVLVEWYCRKKELQSSIEQLLELVKNDKEYYIKKAVVWLNSSIHKHNLK
jgi:3-methyladenine DNA glycosylase AlkD